MYCIKLLYKIVCVGQMPLHLIKLSACMLKERHDFSILMFYLLQIHYEIIYIRDPNPLYMYNSYMYRRYYHNNNNTIPTLAGIH